MAMPGPCPVNCPEGHIVWRQTVTAFCGIPFAGQGAGMARGMHRPQNKPDCRDDRQLQSARAGCLYPAAVSHNRTLPISLKTFAGAFGWCEGDFATAM